MPRWLRYGVVLGIAALVVVLMLSFRRDPHDIRTGTVNKPAAAFTADKLDGDKMERIARLAFWTGWNVANAEERPRTLGRREDWK